MLQNQFSFRQFRLTKCSFFIHNTTPYILQRLDSQIVPRFSDCAVHTHAISTSVKQAFSLAITFELLVIEL